MSAEHQPSEQELRAEIERLKEALDKAEAARDALVREVLPLSRPRPAVDHQRQRRIVALVVLLLSLAMVGMLLFSQMRRASRVLSMGPGGSSAQRMRKGRRLVAAKKHSVVRPRRMATIPIPGLALLGRVALDGAGRMVYLGGWGGRIVAFDLGEDRVRWSVQAHQGAVRDVVWSHDGTLVSGGADGAVKRWRARDGKAIGTLRAAGKNGVRDLDREGPWLAVGGEASELELYRLAPSKGELARKIGGHAGWVRAVALAAGGKRVATGDHSGTVRIFETASGKLLEELTVSDQWTNALSFSPDGRLLAVASFDKRTRVFQRAEKKPLHSFRGHSRRVVSVAFSADGRRLVTASLDRTAVVWDLVKGQLARRLGQHRYAVYGAAFAPGGEFTLTASADGALRLWPRALPLADNMAPLKKPGPGELILRGNTSGERLRIKLLDDKGGVIESGRRELAYLLRSGPDDRRKLPDPKLVELLYRVVDHFGRQREVMVISGYRSDEFNKLRSKQSRQVAKKSRHRKGEAIDFRISGVEVSTLQRYLKRLRVGGVGYYPDSQFVHLDVGPVRSWGGT